MLCEAAAVVLEENNNTETTEANTTNKSNYNRSSNSSSDCGSDMLKTSSSKSKSSSKKYTSSSTSTSTSSSSSHRRSIESEAKLWKKIVGFCTKNTGYKFVDDSFPPCDKSLYIDYKSKNASCFGGNGQHFSNQQQQRPVVKWLRPEQIRTHPNERNLEWTVLNEPNLNDIKQGLLGNCWLLSGLVVILEQIELLERILVSTEYSPYGCYPIRLCHNGEWKLVLVDDLFPCNALTSRLIYSQAIRKQLWVPLIEKAMAKLNGSYESLVAGQTVEALSALTGYPCESIRLEDDPNLDVSSSGSSSPADATAVAEPLDFDMIWTRLLSMKEAGYVLAASCGRTNVDDDRIFTDRGLLPRHAYSVLNIKEVNGNQLIQLRNPWGRYAWTGDWCESSSKWTPEIRKSLEEILSAKSKSKTRPNNNVNSKTTANTTNKTSGETKNETRTTTTTSVVGVKDEGVFWMSFADFVQYFSSVDICKTRLDWFEKRHSGVFASSSARKIQAFHLIVFETSLLDVELFHKSNKNRRENSHLDLCFVVLDYKTRKFVASSKRSIKKFIQAEHMFEPGEYLIVPVSFNFWAAINSSSDIQNSSSTNSDKEKLSSLSTSMMYNLVVHGPRPFYLESEFHSIYLQAEAIIELSMNTGQRSQSGMEGVSIYTLAKGYSGLIVTAENLNERAYFHVELDCVKSSNVVSTRPNQALLTIDSVPPRTRQVLILLSQLEPSKSYSVQYSIKYRLSSNPYLNTWPGNEGEFCKNKPRVDYGLHTPQPSSF